MAMPKGTRWSQRSKKQIIEMLRKHNGLVSMAAEELGMNRSSLQRRIRNNPDLQAALNECREELLDTTESQLIKAVKDGKEWAISLVLKTLGRARGYGDAQEVTVTAMTMYAEVDLSSLSMEELQQLHEITRKVSNPDRS